MRISRSARTVIASLLVGTAFLPAAVHGQVEITGEWTGTFEFINLGKGAALGPANVFNKNLRSIEGEPAMLGEGPITVRIENRIGEHFFGRWTVDKSSGLFVCTMRDAREFVCGGSRSNVEGSVKDDGNLRMCWTSSGANASSGCADLSRPS